MLYSPFELQRRLKALGYYSGVIDGVIGPKSKAAIVAFKRDNGLRARPFVGAITWELLKEKPAIPPLPSSDPPWLVHARQMDGIREVKGKRHNPKIVGLWEAIKAPFRDDETPWCAGFVGACLERTGFRSPRSPAARSYENWKDGVQLKGPKLGCIVVFWRGRPDGWKGHVGFVVGVDQRGRLLVLGGNQGDAVNIKPFDLERVVGFYWPKCFPVPKSSGLKRYTSHAAASTNEA